MTARKPPRRLWRILSAVLVAASLGFVAWTLARTTRTSAALWREPMLWTSIAVAGVIYAASVLAVAIGWLTLVRSLGRAGSLPTRTGLRIYGVSQLYKYLPSNVMHYVGRHAELRRLGIGHLAAMLGALGEIALMLPAALLVGVVAGYAGLSRIDPRLIDLIYVGLAAAAVGALALWLLLPRLRRWRRLAALLRVLSTRQVRLALIVAFGCYVVAFIASGLSFTLVAGWAGPWQGSRAPLLIAIWAAAWTLGFVTPGAPAGVGVREALLIAGLTATTGGDEAALTAIAMRVTTILGDVLLAGAVALAERWPPAKAAILREHEGVPATGAQGPPH